MIPEPQTRLRSVDALRGFDMFWIVGADSLVAALAQVHESSATRFLKSQLTHVKWEGFRFYDLIFPLFLFVAGVSIVFSLDKALAQDGRAAVLERVVRRGALLYLLGVVYYGGISNGIENVAWAGVLHRIAACYVLAALVYAFVSSARGIAALATLLLVGYWALLTFVPIPDLLLERNTVQAAAAKADSHNPFRIVEVVEGSAEGSYEEGRNLTTYVDFLYLRGRKPQRYYVNEGILSTLPAVALPLFGVLAGLLLKQCHMTPNRRVAFLLAAGAAGIALGLAWGLQFPVVKRIWTSSYALVAAGLSYGMLAGFYWMIDVRGWGRPTDAGANNVKTKSEVAGSSAGLLETSVSQLSLIVFTPCVWIGSNALALYLGWRLVPFRDVAAIFVGGDVAALLEQITPGLGAVVNAAMALAMIVALSGWMYKHRVFVRV